MLLQGLVVDQQTFARASRRSTDPFAYLIRISDRTDPAAVRRSVDRRAGRLPRRQGPDAREEYRDEIGAQLDQIVYLLYALLAMSVVISLFGIAN